jgi:uncharacterized membrane protein HdeD (DUF308 family)
MAAILIGNWWALALRGVAAILFGLIAFLWPSITLVALILLFGIYATADGVFALIAASHLARVHGRSGPLLLEGILNLIIAAICFLWPAIALVAIVYLIAIWAMITGVVLILAGMALVRLSGELLLIIAGGLSILLGISLIVQPAIGVIALSWWLGVYAVLFGIAMLSTAFRIRHHPV